MEWHLLFVAVTYLLHARSSYGNVEVKSAALSTGGLTPPNLQLICTNNTWIRIIKEVYFRNYASPNVPAKVLDSSEHINCVKGETSATQTRMCNETVVSDADFCKSHLNSSCTDISVNISYECVAEGQIKNMGEDIDMVVPQKHVYLASPSLLNTTNRCMDGCRCIANTRGLRVQLLYVSASTDISLRCDKCGSVDSIDLTGNDTINRNYFSRNLENTTYSLDLQLNQTDDTSRMWIKIEGDDNITLSCNNGIENTTTTSVSPKTPTTTQATTPTPSQTTTETGSSQTSPYLSTSSSDIDNNNNATGSSTETASTGPSESSSTSSRTTTDTISSSHGTTNTDPSNASSATSITPTDNTAPSSQETTSTSPSETPSTSQRISSHNTVTSSQETTTTSPSETPSTTSTTPTANAVTSSHETTSTRPSSTSPTSPRISSDYTVSSSQGTGSTSPSSETSSGSAAPGSNVTSGSPGTTDAQPFKVVYIYIIAGVACALVVMCVVIGVICRRRGVKRGKIRIPTKEMGRYGGEAHNDVRLPRLTSDNYWEIDLDDYSEDTRMPSFGINDSRDEGNQNHSRNPTPARLNVNGKQTNEHEPIPLTSFGKGEAEGTNTREENRTGNDDYFILEPQPEDAKDREDLIPVDREGRHLLLEESGDLSRPMASQQAEDTSRLSDPYYSEIKDIDGSISFPLNTGTNGEIKEPGQFSQEAGRPVSSGNYEVVDFDSDTEPGPERNSKAKLSQWSPSVKASSSEEASHDQLVMVDNEAYESADKFVRDRTSEAADNGNDGEEDELMMVDNVIYESSGPRRASDQRQPGPDDCRVENHQDRATDSANGDEEDFMVDNIIYESSGPR